jgi:hypothetical protein
MESEIELNNENCKYYTKNELYNEIIERIEEFKEEHQQILKKFNVNSIDEIKILENPNDENAEEIENFNNLCEIDNELEFYNSLLHYLKPKKKNIKNSVELTSAGIKKKKKNFD